MDFVTKRIACSSLSNSQFNWPAVSIPKLHVYHSKVDQSSEKRKWELVEFMIWWKLRKCFLLNAEIYIVSSNFFLSSFCCCCSVCLFIRSWCFVAVCVCVWSLVTKLYTSRNRWKQDKAINFSMPKCCERIVQPVDNMSLSWPTTVTERNGKKILCWFEWTLGYTFTEFTFLWCSLYSVRKHFFSAAAARKVAQNPKLI